MNKQEALEWATGQDVVKVRAFKENEEDKFTFVVGEYVVSPLIFDNYEEAEKYLKENFKLTNLDLSIIGAMCQKLNNIYKQQQ
jgi:UTP-glucose-1-phosphate uridylyltransferase